MEMRVEYNTKGVDWNRVVEILKEVGMAYKSSKVHERAFNNSHSVVFVFDKDNLVAFGRMISDGEYQSAIYDVAVLPAYQGQGIGSLILKKLIDATPDCNFILYASPSKEAFYRKENFRKMKTGMALFLNQDRMQDLGFIE